MSFANFARPHVPMPKRVRSVVGPLALLFISIVVVASAAAFGALPAAAHTELESSNPADGDRLTQSPDVITLTFNEDLNAEFLKVAVLDADDVHHEAGSATLKGGTVTQAVGTLTNGEYRVTYRVASADGHPVTGALSFTVLTPRVTTTASPEIVSPATDPTPIASAASVDPTTGTPTATDDAQAAANESDGPSGWWLAALSITAFLIGLIAYVLSLQKPKKPKRTSE